jgi:hypothetical protein
MFDKISKSLKIKSLLSALKIPAPRSPLPAHVLAFPSICPALNLGNTYSRFTIIYIDGEGVPISFPLGNDRLALITSLKLNLRFWLSEDFMYMDEEVFDANSGDLIHTIGQSPICDKDSKHWLLKLGRF